MKRHKKLPEHLQALRSLGPVSSAARGLRAPSASKGSHPQSGSPRLGSRDSQKPGQEDRAAVVCSSGDNRSPLFQLYTSVCKDLVSLGFELQRNGIILHFGKETTNIMFVRFSHVIVS